MNAQSKKRIMLAVSLLLSLLFCVYGAVASWLAVDDNVKIWDYYGQVRIAAVTVRVFSVIAVACVFALCVAELIKNKDTGFRFVAYGMGTGAGLIFACFFDLIDLELNKMAWLFVVVPVVLILGFEAVRYLVLRDIIEEEHKPATAHTYRVAVLCVVALIAITGLLVNMFLKVGTKGARHESPMLFSTLYTSVAVVWIIYAMVTRKNIWAVVRFSAGFAFFATQILGLAYKAACCSWAYGIIGTDILLVFVCSQLFCVCGALAVLSVHRLFIKPSQD